MNELSAQLLLQVKLQQPTEELKAVLENYSLAALQSHLYSDKQKKAFWMNIYNAFFQILRREQSIQKPDIYRQPLISIAGRHFSLDDIEHGILRRFRTKWSLGYFPDLFAASDIKKLAVSKIDFRIHFALNCGAKSCPPIAFYTPDQLDEQLDLATTTYLEEDTLVSKEKQEVHISRLFQWFVADFGGRRGTRKILKEYLQLDTNGMKLIFKDYDWEEELHNFTEVNIMHV